MSDGEHVVLILKIYYLIQPQKCKTSLKLNILEQGFRKGKIRDRKFYYFQLFKFISAVFCRGQGPPVLKVGGAVAPPAPPALPPLCVHVCITVCIQYILMCVPGTYVRMCTYSYTCVHIMSTYILYLRTYI